MEHCDIFTLIAIIIMWKVPDAYYNNSGIRSGILDTYNTKREQNKKDDGTIIKWVERKKNIEDNFNI